MPPHVTIVDPGSGSWTGDSISWQTTITPTGLVSFTYDLRYDAPVGEEIEMPPARLTIVDDGETPMVTFDSNVVTLASKFPLIVNGGPPLKLTQDLVTTMPLTVTNLSAFSSSGSLIVQVKTLGGAVVFDQSSPFSVAGQGAQSIDVSLLLGEPPGQYIVSATVTQGSATEPVFERFIQIVESTTGEHLIYLPLVLRNN
jgi:hypothetical protein